MSQQAMGYSALGLGDRPLQALAICFMQVQRSGTFRDTKLLCHPLSMVALLYCLPENVLHCWSDAYIKRSPFSAICVQRSS